NMPLVRRCGLFCDGIVRRDFLPVARRRIVSRAQPSVKPSVTIKTHLRRASRLLLALAVPLSIGAQQAPAPKDTSAETKDPHAAQPERPTVATHAGTVAPGWFEVETGVERDHFAPSTDGGSTPTVLKFGLADNVQLSLFGAAVKAPGQSAGVGDLAVGIKWR